MSEDAENQVQAVLEFFQTLLHLNLWSHAACFLTIAPPVSMLQCRGRRIVQDALADYPPIMASKRQARMLRAVADSLKRSGIRRDALILLALSGGPDSVALFHAMLAMRDRFGYRVAAAHVNHAIRGAESDR